MEKTMPHGQYKEPALTDPVIRDVLTASGLDWRFGTCMRGVLMAEDSYRVGDLSIVASTGVSPELPHLSPEGVFWDRGDQSGTLRTANDLLQLLSPLMQEAAVREVFARDVGKMRKRLRKMRRRRKRRSRRRRPIQKNPQTGKVDLDSSPMMFNRARDGGRRQTNYKGKKVQIRSLHKPKPLVGPWEPKNKAKFRLWNRKYQQWKKRWKAKWEGRKKKGSLFDETTFSRSNEVDQNLRNEMIRLAASTENVQLKDALLDILEGAKHKRASRWGSPREAYLEGSREAAEGFLSKNPGRALKESLKSREKVKKTLLRRAEAVGDLGRADQLTVDMLGDIHLLWYYTGIIHTLD